MWNEIFKVDMWVNSKYIIIYSILVIIFIFLLASVVDFFRSKYLEPIYVKSKYFLYVEERLNKFYNF